jgi:hypothetical protein
MHALAFSFNKLKGTSDTIIIDDGSFSSREVRDRTFLYLRGFLTYFTSS